MILELLENGLIRVYADRLDIVCFLISVCLAYRWCTIRTLQIPACVRFQTILSGIYLLTNRIRTDTHIDQRWKGCSRSSGKAIFIIALFKVPRSPSLLVQFWCGYLWLVISYAAIWKYLHSIYTWDSTSNGRDCVIYINVFTSSYLSSGSTRRCQCASRLKTASCPFCCPYSWWRY